MRIETLKKITTAMILLSVFTTFVFIIFLICLIIILANELVAFLFTIFVILWIVTFLLTVKTAEKEKVRLNEQ